MKNKIYPAVVKFITTGCVVAIVQLSTFYLLSKNLPLPYLTTSTLAFIIAFLTNFFLQKYWSFSDISGRVFPQMGLFFANSLINMLVNVVFMFLLVEYAVIPPFFAQVVTMVVLMFYNFLIYRKIFRL